MEFFVELLLELVLQLLLELPGALLEGTLDVSGRTGRFLKGISYLLLGIGLGYVSYLILPQTITGRPPSILASMILIPTTVAFSYTMLARWTERRWEWSLGVSTFGFSFLFAWAFSISRFICLLNQF